MKNTIIVPDVHGRTFWKVLKTIDVKNCDIIFLGDMCDVYDFERIPKDEAVENFKEIISFKKEYPDNVTLLLGNHDLEYFADTEACRMDFKNKEIITKLFLDNLALFDIGCYREINGKKYTFSHSCILKEWVKYINKHFSDKVRFEGDNPISIIDKLNDTLHSNIDDMSLYLNMVSYARGGHYDCGSPIWAHWDEIDQFNYEFENWYQVFGHSQQFSYEMIKEINTYGYTDKLAEPIITEWFACLDCKQLFIIKNNIIEKY